MKLKQMAVRGLVGLAVLVCVCMFFARTVLTITTPKVQLITASTGRLEQKMTYTAKVSFPQTDEIVFPEAQKSQIKVASVHVKEGQRVEKGEAIYTCEMPSFEEELKKLQETYDEKNKALLDLDIKNKGSSKESRQNELYNDMLKSQEEMTKLASRARTLAADAGIALSGNIAQWQKQLAALGDEVSDEVREAADLAAAARKTYNEAYATFFAVMEDRRLRVNDSVFEYIRQRDDALRAMDEAADAMAVLTARAVELSVLRADHDGYIETLPLKVGDVYDGTKAAYTMSREGAGPVLRIPLSSDMTRTIADGTRADVVIDDYTTERTEVEKTELDKDGVKYLYIVIPESLTKSATGLRKILGDEGVQVKITYRAKNSTTLLPPSAVRNEGEGSDYVYLVQQDYGGFMSASSMKVVKTPVTVLERSDKAVSVSEDLSYQQVADREDRALSDGMTVMEYVN